MAHLLLRWPPRRAENVPVARLETKELSLCWHVFGSFPRCFGWNEYLKPPIQHVGHDEFPTGPHPEKGPPRTWSRLRASRADRTQDFTRLIQLDDPIEA